MAIETTDKKCFICGNVIKRYAPLPDYYFEEAEKHGYPIYKSVYETLNLIEYICPICAAADRERLYAMHIKEHFDNLEPNENFILLDIAPAKALSDYINSNWNIDYQSMDLFMKDVTYSDDLTNITSIQDNQVDFIICSHVLEHVNDDAKALSEIYRIMKPDASGIIMVPIDLTMRETDEDINTTEAERWRRFGQLDHIRKYAKDDFVSRLKSVGFNVQELGIQHFGIEKFYQNSLTQTSTLYVVRK